MVNDLNEATIKAIKDAVVEAMRNGGPTPQPGVMRLPEDERLRVMVADIVHRELVVFEKTVEGIVHKEIEDTLRRVGIRIDDEHIDQTADDFRSMLKTHKNLNRLATGLGITLAGGMFFGLLKLLGLNIESFGGKP